MLIIKINTPSVQGLDAHFSFKAMSYVRKLSTAFACFKTSAFTARLRASNNNANYSTDTYSSFGQASITLARHTVRYNTAHCSLINEFNYTLCVLIVNLMMIWPCQLLLLCVCQTGIRVLHWSKQKKQHLYNICTIWISEVEWNVVLILHWWTGTYRNMTSTLIRACRSYENRTLSVGACS